MVLHVQALLQHILTRSLKPIHDQAIPERTQQDLTAKISSIYRSTNGYQIFIGASADEVA